MKKPQRDIELKMFMNKIRSMLNLILSYEEIPTAVFDEARYGNVLIRVTVESFPMKEIIK